MGELEDFVGCTINWDLTKMTLNIYQSDLTTKVTQVFNKDVKSLMTFNTPDIPHKGIVRNQETDKTISYDIQKRCRSGVVLLLYLVKQSRPELSNTVRELSKFMYK